MAHIRRKGRVWQAVVKLPTGKQVTRTDPLKGVVAAWAKEVESDLRRERWHDPRQARSITVAAWREEWSRARVVEVVTRRKDDAHWRTRLDARWGETPLSEIRRADVQAWVARMVEEGVGAHTIAGTIGHFGAMLQAAVEADPPLLAANPARGVRLPRTDAGRLRFLTRAEYRAVDAELAEPYRTLVEMGCFAGLRWGELSGLPVEHVDLERAEVHVRQVLTRTGLRSYGKSNRSHRTVPIPAHLVTALRLLPMPEAGLVFAGSSGGPLDEGNWRRRVWHPALVRAGITDAPPPHTMRHTAASWLVMAGVDLYRVQSLLGHESYRTTEKYAHLAPDAHDVLRGAWDALAG